MKFSEVFEIRNGEQSHKFMDKVINYMNHLKSLDGKYELEIKEYKSNRSIEQNNLYWQWISIIGNDLGYHKNEMHEALLEHFSIPYTFKGIDGKVKQKQLRSSMMSVEQMSDYMNQVQQFANEQGIMLPSPQDRI